MLLHILAEADSSLSTFSKELIVTLVCTVLIPFAANWLHKKSKESKARAENEKMSRKEYLEERLKAFLFDTAANIAEKRFPLLAKQVINGQVTKSETVKTILRQWGDDLKDKAKEHFGNEGVDIAKEFADATLDNWIELAANKVSPFPGMETAKVILQGQVSNILVDKGVDYTRVHVLKLVDGKLSH